MRSKLKVNNLDGHELMCLTKTWQIKKCIHKLPYLCEHSIGILASEDCYWTNMGIHNTELDTSMWSCFKGIHKRSKKRQVIIFIFSKTAFLYAWYIWALKNKTKQKTVWLSKIFSFQYIFISLCMYYLDIPCSRTLTAY